MAVYDPNNENLSDVVTAFSIAFVGLCRALEQQHNVMPDSIVQAIKLEMEDIHSGPVPPEIRNIVAKIASGIDGKAIEVRRAQSTR